MAADLSDTLSTLDPAEASEALEGFPLPAFSVHPDGITAWQNAAARQLFGDLRGAHFAQTQTPEGLPGTSERFEALLAGKPLPRVRNIVRDRNGELVRVEVTSTPIYKDGRIVGAFGIAVPLASESGSPPGAMRLTPRERDVLGLLIQGKTTSEMADELHLSPQAVRNYIRGLLRALQAGSRLEAVLIALREGLVSLVVR